MPRIFAGLAIGLFAVLCTTAALGFLKGQGGQSSRHVFLAVFSIVLSCLIQAAAFTYMTVTAKMMGQALHLARLDLEPLSATKRLKRSISGYLAVIVAVNLAAAATGAIRHREASFWSWHVLSAIVLVGTHAVVLMRQYVILTQSAAIFDAALREYSSVRAHPTSEDRVEHPKL